VHGRERAVDREGGLGQQPGRALEQAAALDAAVQVQERRAHEARLVAEVEQALPGSCVQADILIRRLHRQHTLATGRPEYRHGIRTTWSVQPVPHPVEGERTAASALHATRSPDPPHALGACERGAPRAERTSRAASCCAVLVAVRPSATGSTTSVRNASTCRARPL